eukprot:8058356-Alexandrium_andersonii.AAC.1
MAQRAGSCPSLTGPFGARGVTAGPCPLNRGPLGRRQDVQFQESLTQLRKILEPLRGGCRPPDTPPA